MKRFFLYVYLYMLIMFLAVNFVVVPVFYRAVQDYFQQPVGLFWSNILSGYFQIIEDDLSRLPVDRWSRTVDDLQTHLAFPIGVIPMDATNLSESEALALRRGEIVVQGADENFQHRIGQSGMVLRMGPMPKIESIPGFQSKQWVTQALLSLVVGVLFLVFALIWALPLAKSLKRISTAAAAFGQGALDVRAKVARRSSLAPLAEAFNGMANRIQELITSHKELTHMVSHELRTPLARILFNMEMMGPAEKNTEREQHQEEIRRNVDELTMLVSELLTYARFDRENYNPRKEMLNLAPWLEELTARWNDDNERIRIDYRNISTDDKVPIQANPRFLERAVCNLLQNAVRHSRQSIHVTLETEGNLCAIHVDDDGPGVAETDRQKIFEPFVRLDDSKEHEAEGYGLGLAIVRRVAQWHGGRVTIENAPIGGARFTLRWPHIQQAPK